MALRVRIVDSRMMSKENGDTTMPETDKCMATIIKCPFIPFCAPLSSPIDVGTTVVVRGKVPRFAERFVFDFIIGNDFDEYTRENGDIALRFNPRFDDDRVIVKNSRIRNRWGSEEKQRKDFPFARNEWFEVVFVVKPSYFTISVDGVQIGLFLHRIPFRFIGLFSIDGDVEVESVIFTKQQFGKYTETVNGDSNQNGQIIERNKSGPTVPKLSPRILKRKDKTTQTLPPKIQSHIIQTQIKHLFDHNCNLYDSQQSVEDNMVLSQKTLYNPPMPFTYALINGVRSGMVIVISGQTKKTPKRFDMTFKSNSSSSDSPDEALHFVVRFDKKYIVCKSRVNGEWIQKEKDSQSFPFKNSNSEQYFELKFRIDYNKFVIAFNGIYLTEYISKITEMSNINLFEADGDINLSFVKFDLCEIN